MTEAVRRKGVASHWRQLDPLTRGLIVFGLVNVLGINLLALLTQSTVGRALAMISPAGPVDTSTTLHHTAAFLLGRGGDDSWDPIRQALEYLRAPDGRPLYDVLFFERGVLFQYPPTSLLLVEPLGLFSPTRLPAIGLLNALSWLAVAVTAGLATRVFFVSLRTWLGDRHAAWFRDRWLLTAAAIGLSLTFYPVVKAFTLGQIQTWSTMLFAGAALAFIGGRRRFAGALCGAMCLVKPPLGLLLLWALLRGHRRFAVGWVAVVVPGLVASVWRYGLQNHWNYAELLSFLARHSWAYHPNQTMNGLLNRLLFMGSNLVWDPGFLPYSVWVTTGTLLTSALLIGAALFRRAGRGDRDQALDFFIAALSFTMASPLAWEHHYGVMLPMFAWTLPAALATWKERRIHVVVLAVSYVLVSNVYAAAGLLANSRLNLVQSYLFLGALLFLGNLYALRRARSRPGVAR